MKCPNCSVALKLVLEDDNKISDKTKRGIHYDQLCALDWEPVTDLIGPGQEQLGAEVENLRDKLNDILQKLEYVI